MRRLLFLWGQLEQRLVRSIEHAVERAALFRAALERIAPWRDACAQARDALFDAPKRVSAYRLKPIAARFVARGRRIAYSGRGKRAEADAIAVDDLQLAVEAVGR
eukprot:3649360-Prymnesium_polylepis.1